ncbi:GNAT family N-acetyltransferase [Pseudonocardia sp. RS11V-5]|uniref:GNAT family N-acetyltransferase n=1 Tax=Pseudonocardia terrae TaxID=2905831 RepID=UPI001E4903A2|nr:GNAT family N-acetyltransferase [Pseudonocardia terrae]MCE3552039.1 GNAT family N-acetyltransferase [Pseudonocardia terrae]
MSTTGTDPREPDTAAPRPPASPAGAARPAAEVRVLEPGELRSAHTLFRAALHGGGPADDEHWALTRLSYAPGRTFGVDLPAGTLAGTAMSFGSALTVPGGARVPMAAVTRVGVRADRTRRGLLTGLMREQLSDAADRGEIAATLRASEARIYGRFGYGVASRGRNLRVTAGARFRTGAPAGGEVRLLDPDEAATVLPPLYARILAATARPGPIERDEGWWAHVLRSRRTADEARGIAVHTGPRGDDGFATWTVRQDGTDFGENVLELHDLHAATPQATAGLWRFLLRIDLLRAVSAHLRPLDEPVDLFLEDPRACRTTGVDDETWLRLLDVPAAFAARSWGESGGEPLRLRVHDALFPGNDGVHVIDGRAAGTNGAGPPDPSPAEDWPADLECDVAGLAMAYLGDRRPSELVASGWWTVHDGAAVARADRLFAATGPDTVPWCGTFF